MAGTDGEDGYSDDDLDALETEDFLELQQRALQSTQRPRQALTAESQNHVLPPVISAPPGFTRQQEVENTSSGLRAQAYPNNTSSDYGDLDDEVLDAGLLDDPTELLASKPANYALQLAVGENTQREQWRQQRFSIAQQSGAPVQVRRDDQTRPAFSLPERNRGPSRDSGHCVNEHEMLDEGDVEPPLDEQEHSVDALHTEIEEVRRM